MLPNTVKAAGRRVFVGQALLPVPEVPALERWNNRNILASAFAAVSKGQARVPVLPQAKSSARIGNLRMRLPVAAKIALHSAGTTGGTESSPEPVGFSVLGTMWTSTTGIASRRSTG